ncbi:hypothetical protein AB0M36_14795 [Actinoplanes sp. NPDC051346]|uniref:hypothetical protein n=1 Tax=Actinoplanes sp. NPDC051346 TaxID=3155048 RepID=UPI003448747E
MRHLRSILYALVLAPAAWILCGVGFDQDLTGRARDNGGVESLGGPMLLLLAGAAYGILLFAPISPAGPLLAGLAFLGVGLWARIAPEAYAGSWPADITKDGFNVSTPGYGLVLLLAVPLVGTALSARRWAGYEPPQVVLVGTIGRARGAAPVPGMPALAIPPQRMPHPVSPVDDGDEKTTVLSALFPVESTQDVAKSEEPTRDVAASDERTTVLPSTDGERTTVLPTADDERTTVLPSTDGERTTVLRSSDDERTTVLRSSDDERTTLLPSSDDERTTLLPAGNGDRTQVIRSEPTVAGLERPADEAADDTRPLILPSPRPPADDETTRLL